METLKKIGVLGAGMMGAEIALSFALKDADVLLKDISLDFATAGKNRLEGILGKWQDKGKMEKADAQEALARITPQDDYAGFDQVDLVVEAVLEEKEIKIVGFYSKEEEKNVVDGTITSGRYIDKTCIVWIDVNKNSKEFYLEGFSETPSVVISDNVKIRNVTKIDLIKGLESFDPRFYTAVHAYFIAYPFLTYIGIAGVVCVALYGVLLWKR